MQRRALAFSSAPYPLMAAAAALLITQLLPSLAHATDGSHAERRAASAISGTVILDGATSHEGTIVTLSSNVVPISTTTVLLAAAVALLFLRRRRRQPAAAAVVLACAVCAAASAADDMQAVTDSFGSYSFQALGGDGAFPPGAYLLTYAHAGYIGAARVVELSSDSAPEVIVAAVSLFPEAISPTASPSPTHSPTATLTPPATPTGTPSATASATGTETQTPTESPTATESPTETETPTATATGTITPTATVSPTPTITPTPPDTATPTATTCPDTDGDRLCDSVETNTGVFVSSADTGTDPANTDTDGDAIDDGDEVLGTTAGLDLPALGASPVHQDIFLEYDWFDDANDCVAHSHQPSSAAAGMVAATFAAAPISNPDGVTGITVHQDFGQDAVFAGGNLVADADGVLTSGVNSAEFASIKAANFAADRQGYFHYVLFPHRYNTSSTSSGQAELNGNDLLVSLYCYYGVDSYVAQTILHELGHNLGLRHGGDEDCNYKPNYNSLMNYTYQFPGVDSDCGGSPAGDGVADYSYGTRIDLDENDLDESQGVCGPGGPAWDWNESGGTDPPGLAYDVNSYGFEEAECGELLTTSLRDYDDWGNLNLAGIGQADRLARAPTISCQPVPSGPLPAAVTRRGGAR